MHTSRFDKKIIYLHLVFLLMAASPTMAGDKVSFLNKNAERLQLKIKLKIDCDKSTGKHDAFPTIKCPDSKGNSETFDPGNQWEEVKVTSVCFRNKVTDSIKACIKIIKSNGMGESFACIQTGFNTFIPFKYDQTRWIKYEANTPECKPLVKPIDVPRGASPEKLDADNNE